MAIDVRKLRLARGLTQEDLARLLGTDAVTVSRWERGVSIPRPSARKRLGEVLGPQRPKCIVPFADDPTTRLREVDRHRREQEALRAAF